MVWVGVVQSKKREIRWTFWYPEKCYHVVCRDWYNVILSLVVETRARHMPSAEQFWGRKGGTEVSSDWRDLYERPSSVASVDRRHRHRHRHKRRGKSHSKPDTSQVSSPALRSLSVDRDSGNYSLQTASDKQSAAGF